MALATRRARILGTMEHAINLSVNGIDTAAACRLEHSEEVVGRLLGELPVAQLRPPCRPADGSEANHG